MIALRDQICRRVRTIVWGSVRLITHRRGASLIAHVPGQPGNSTRGDSLDTKELMQAFSHYRPTRTGATAKPSGLSSRLHIVISNLRWAVCAEHAVNSAMELSEASRLRPMVQSSPLVDLAGRIRGDCDVVLRGVISRTQYNRPSVPNALPRESLISRP